MGTMMPEATRAQPISSTAIRRNQGGTNNWGQQAKLTASDAAEADYFGLPSISGDYAIVGAYCNDDAGHDSGSAYSFLRSGSSWSQKAKVTASDGAAYGYFGISVSISGDYAIVGAYEDASESGSAYIYHSIDDLSLPVELSVFTATTSGENVILQWRTESEINNLGFDVYRSESPEGQFVKVNPVYIKGAGTDATPHDYQFADESAVVGKTYYYYLEAISFSGERERSYIIKVIVDVSGKVKVTGLMQPTTFALLQNFPNPFNPETWIPFRLAKDADVTIRIFDIRGQEVRTIHVGQMPAGYYDTKGKAVLWDGRDSYGQEVSSGIYFYNLTAGKFHATRKLTIIK